MLRTNAQRTTRQHPDECPTCNGLGQDEHSTTEMVRRKVRDAHGVMRECFVTLKQGSGCLCCGGTGRLPGWAEIPERIWAEIAELVRVPQ